MDEVDEPQAEEVDEPQAEELAPPVRFRRGLITEGWKYQIPISGGYGNLRFEAEATSDGLWLKLRAADYTVRAWFVPYVNVDVDVA